MMRRLAATSIRYRVLALALVAAVVVLGFAQLRTMSRDVLPEFDEPTVDVQTEALGLSSAEVEQLVTVPLEQDLLNGVPFVDRIESKSLPGLSWIHIVFEHGTPIYRARQVVTERMTQAAGIPAVAKPPQMIQPVSSTSRLLLVGLSSPKVSLIDMGVLARWTIRPRLLGVPGVANVAIWGQRERQLQVQVDPQRLADADVTLDQVISTTGNALWWSPLGRLEANTPGTGGFFDGPTQRLGLFHESPIKKPSDLARVPIEAAEGASGAGSELRLGDVANVVNDHQPLIGDSVLRNGSGLMLVIEKLPGANTVDVTHGVDEALDELAPGLRGITLDRSMFRPATYVEESGNNAATALLIGLGLAVLLLLLVFFDWRIALVGAVSVTASQLGAVLVLGLRGETLNTMLIAGLGVAMAILVADVVTDAVNVRRYLHGEATHVSERGTLVADALAETRRPLAYATVIILLALVPVAVLHGESGAFLPSIALSYGAAIVASAIVALIATPALSSLLLAGGRDPGAAPVVRRLHNGFAAWSRRGFGGMRAALVALIGLVVVGIVSLPFLDHERSLVPSFQDPNVLVRWNGAPGTSVTEMDRISARVLRELRAVRGVRDAGGHVGRAVLGDQVVGANAGELWVTLDDGADHDATLAAIRSTVGGYPGIDHAVTSYPSQRVADLLHRPRHDLTVRIYGANGVTTKAKAGEIRRAIASVPGVTAPTVHLAPTEPTIRVEVDLGAAQRAGIKPGDVRRGVRRAAVGSRRRGALPGPEGVRRRRLGDTVDPQGPRQRPRPADRNPGRRHRSARRPRDGPGRARAVRDRARGRLAVRRRHGRGEGQGCRRRRGGRPRSHRRGPLPPRAPRGPARRLREPPLGEHSVLRDPCGGGHRLLPPVPGCVRQLAARRRGDLRSTARALGRCPRRRHRRRSVVARGHCGPVRRGRHGDPRVLCAPPPVPGDRPGQPVNGGA